MVAGASEQKTITHREEAVRELDPRPTLETSSRRQPTRDRKKSARTTSATSSQVAFPHRLLPLLLLLPELIIVGLFFIWPSAQAIYESTIQSNAFGLGARFAGLANFNAALSNGYPRALEVTGIFTLVTTVASMAIGLLLAVQIEHTGRFKGLYRTVFIWSYAVPGAVAGTVWLFLFEPRIGPAAKILADLGVHWNFALSAPQSFLLIIAMTIWQQSAYNFVFFSAGLQAIPTNVLEAASLDASPRQRFWHITIPLLSPTTLFVLVMDILAALFGSFSVIDIISQGGPGGATTTLVYALYRDGFQNGDVGLAGAETLLLFFISAILLLVQFRISRRRVHYR